MTQSKLDTVRTYYGASALRDYETAGACVGSGYVSIDRHKGVIYRTIDELLEAQAEDAAWWDRTFDIQMPWRPRMTHWSFRSRSQDG
jgi:hypothetical protein